MDIWFIMKMEEMGGNGLKENGVNNLISINNRQWYTEADINMKYKGKGQINTKMKNTI